MASNGRGIKRRLAAAILGALALAAPAAACTNYGYGSVAWGNGCTQTYNENSSSYGDPQTSMSASISGGSLAASMSSSVTATASGISVQAHNSATFAGACINPPYYSSASAYSTQGGSFSVSAAGVLTISFTMSYSGPNPTTSTSLAFDVWGPLSGGGGNFHRYYSGGVAPQLFSLSVLPGDFSYRFYLTTIAGSEGTSSSTLNGSISGFDCSPAIHITRPGPGQVLIAGTQDSVEWTSNGVVNVDISLCDSCPTPNGSYAPLGSASATARKFVFTVPNDLTRTARITVENQAAPFNDDTTDSLRIKPRALTRVNAAGEYELFGTALDVWPFGNSASTMWPASWYDQFDYANGFDPATQLDYPGLFAAMGASTFPDWPMWVEAFGPSACYWSTTLPLYKFSMVLKWMSQSYRTFEGSCSGLSTSALAQFFDTAGFRSRYPWLPLGPLGALPINPTTTHIGNLWQTLAFTPAMSSARRTDRQMTGGPTVALNAIRGQLELDRPYLGYLSIDSDTDDLPGHAVIPYAVEQDGANPAVWHVHVADPNRPFSIADTVHIDTAANNGLGTMTYVFSSTLPVWVGSGNNVYLQTDPLLYLAPPAPGPRRPGLPVLHDASEDTTVVVVSSTSRDAIAIVDSLANTTGYLQGALVAQIPGSVVESPASGLPAAPASYQLPHAPYAVTCADGDTRARTTLFSRGSALYAVRRAASLLPLADRVFYDGGVAVLGDASEERTVSLDACRTTSTDERLWTLRGATLAEGDSLYAALLQDDALRLRSVGSAARVCTLEVTRATAAGAALFRHAGLVLPAGCAARAAADWEDSTLATVTLDLDLDADGVTEQSVTLANDYLAPTSAGSDQPAQRGLRPGAVVRWTAQRCDVQLTLDRASRVECRVIDAAGRLRATVVDASLPRGITTRRWNLRDADDRRLGAGVYFVRTVITPLDGSRRTETTARVPVLR